MRLRAPALVASLVVALAFGPALAAATMLPAAKTRVAASDFEFAPRARGRAPEIRTAPGERGRRATTLRRARAFTPFGEVRDGSEPAEFMFQGLRHEDVGTAQPVYGAWFRDVDPSSGRWTRRDPGGFIDGFNRYRALGNNPYRFLDRSGRAINLFAIGKAAGVLISAILGGELLAVGGQGLRSETGREEVQPGIEFLRNSKVPELERIANERLAPSRTKFFRDPGGLTGFAIGGDAALFNREICNFLTNRFGIPQPVFIGGRFGDIAGDPAAVADALLNELFDLSTESDEDTFFALRDFLDDLMEKENDPDALDTLQSLRDRLGDSFVQFRAGGRGVRRSNALKELNEGRR